MRESLCFKIILVYVFRTEKRGHLGNFTEIEISADSAFIFVKQATPEIIS